jgi:hypothetical protein
MLRRLRHGLSAAGNQARRQRLAIWPAEDQSMKMFLRTLTFVMAMAGAASAQALPLHTPPPSPRAGSIVLVGGACGLAVRRDPSDGCDVVYRSPYHRNYRSGARRYYRDPSRSYALGYDRGFYDGYTEAAGSGRLLVDQGACGERGMVSVCGGDGVCWAACHW